MKRTLIYLLTLLLLATSQAWAGVVEDAEEELKKLGKGREQQQITSTTRNTRPPNSPSTSSVSSGPRNGSGVAVSSRPASAGTSSSGSSVNPVAVAATTTGDKPAETGRAKMDKEDKRQGRLVSFGVILLLALLIFFATAAARRLGSSE